MQSKKAKDLKFWATKASPRKRMKFDHTFQVIVEGVTKILEDIYPSSRHPSTWVDVIGSIETIENNLTNVALQLVEMLGMKEFEPLRDVIIKAATKTLAIIKQLADHSVNLREILIDNDKLVGNCSVGNVSQLVRGKAPPAETSGSKKVKE